MPMATRRSTITSTRDRCALIDEDAAAVKILQAMRDAEGAPTEVSIRLDTAALVARRMLKRRLADEASATAAA